MKGITRTTLNKLLKGGYTLDYITDKMYGKSAIENKKTAKSLLRNVHKNRVKKLSSSIDQEIERQAIFELRENIKFGTFDKLDPKKRKELIKAQELIVKTRLESELQNQKTFSTMKTKEDKEIKTLLQASAQRRQREGQLLGSIQGLNIIVYNSENLPNSIKDRILSITKQSRENLGLLASKPNLGYTLQDMVQLIYENNQTGNLDILELENLIIKAETSILEVSGG